MEQLPPAQRSSRAEHEQRRRAPVPRTRACNEPGARVHAHPRAARPARPSQPASLALPSPPRGPSLNSPRFPSWPCRARGAPAPPVKVWRVRGPAAAASAPSSRSCPFLVAAHGPRTRSQLPRVSSRRRVPTPGQPGPQRRRLCRAPTLHGPGCSRGPRAATGGVWTSRENSDWTQTGALLRSRAKPGSHRGGLRAAEA